MVRHSLISLSFTLLVSSISSVVQAHPAANPEGLKRNEYSEIGVGGYSSSLSPTPSPVVTSIAARGSVGGLEENLEKRSSKKSKSSTKTSSTSSTSTTTTSRTSSATPTASKCKRADGDSCDIGGGQGGHIPRPTDYISICVFPDVDCFGEIGSAGSVDNDGSGSGSDTGTGSEGEGTSGTGSGTGEDGSTDNTSPEGSDESDDDKPVHSDDERRKRSLSSSTLSKRGDRTFKAKLGSKGTLEFDSFYYPLPRELYTTKEGQKLTPHGFIPASKKEDEIEIVDDVKAVFTITKDEWTPKPGTWDMVVEHIVELGSILNFMKDLLKDKTNKAKYEDFFKDHWKAKLTQKEVDARKNPAKCPQVKNWEKPEERSLNGLVFQALGSKVNREDFVLCEEGINGMKARLWNLIDPISKTNMNTYINGIVGGGVEFNYLVTPFRTVLQVYNYLNEKEVTDRLQNAVENVRLELSNVKDLTNQDVELAKPWFDFMKTRLANIETHGEAWLKTWIPKAVAKYEDDLEKLNDLLKEQETKRKKDPAAFDKSATAKLTSLKKDHTAAKEDLEDLMKQIEKQKKAIRKLKDDHEQLNQQTPPTAKVVADQKKELAAENTKLNKLKKQVFQKQVLIGKARRAASTTQPADTKKEINQVEEIIKHLTKFTADAKKIKMPKAK